MTSDLSTCAARIRDFIADPLRTENQFATLALELFALQFKHNAAYHKICAFRRATPLIVSDWTQIPAVPTTAFKEFELTCLSPERRTQVFHSSGTTGQRPSQHFHHPESLAVYETSLWPWFAANVFPEFQSEISSFQLLSLTPPPAATPHSSLVHMFETVRQAMSAPNSVFLGGVAPDGAWQIDLDQTLARLRQAGDENRPVLLLGTAFSFVHLLDFLADRSVQLELPSGSRVLETGGYKGRAHSLPKPELHRLITHRLAVPRSHIVGEYGMSELGSQAYDTMLDATHHPQPTTRAFHFPPWARGQIISPGTNREVGDGETGLIRVFDLANVFSVQAIQTEDLAIRRGDDFELIGRAEFAEPRGCSLMAV